MSRDAPVVFGVLFPLGGDPPIAKEGTVVIFFDGLPTVGATEGIPIGPTGPLFSGKGGGSGVPESESVCISLGIPNVG